MTVLGNPQISAQTLGKEIRIFLVLAARDVTSLWQWWHRIYHQCCYVTWNHWRSLTVLEIYLLRSMFNYWACLLLKRSSWRAGAPDMPGMEQQAQVESCNYPSSFLCGVPSPVTYLWAPCFEHPVPCSSRRWPQKRQLCHYPSSEARQGWGALSLSGQLPGCMLQTGRQNKALVTKTWRSSLMCYFNLQR